MFFSVGNTLQRARRRVEDQFNKFGFGKGKKKDGSVEETQGSCKLIISQQFYFVPQKGHIFLLSIVKIIV